MRRVVVKIEEEEGSEVVQALRELKRRTGLKYWAEVIRYCIMKTYKNEP
ncbi:hypothetical protein Asulf_01180 [Archaeoglobus sulfaticallidus PM70-1]|uniref:Uncharacterized protein n=1 Tax=Archaeoglobus sulfaticallidus PM70-1 TaxID=387631 RepID=N0BC30_9EURY|nr:hypothetical protein [Archaeoglobus sulfaticallidus]AGK61179.1 hypothetical protein Asulf_01180 [Archaeoglobus sulfaticallidus PM70-1]